MIAKKKRLRASQVYLILDKAVCGARPLDSVLKKAIAGGVDIVQLRDKTSSTRTMIEDARRLLAICREHGVLFIINDRIDVALAVRPDGIHLGQDDLPVAIARNILGRGVMIGLSCHDPGQVKRSRTLACDYLGFGPVFATETKPGMRPRGIKALHEALKTAAVPVFAIGGIKAAGLEALKTRSPLRVAVCREICLARDIKKAASRLKEKLKKRTVHV